MLTAEFKAGLKLLVTDLDGTVVFDHGKGVGVTDRMSEVLRKLQASGVVVALASGRIHHAMIHIANDMGLTGPIISCNGAQIWLPDQYENEGIFHHEPLPLDVAREVVLACKEAGLHLNYYLSEGIYARKFQPFWDIYHGRTAAPMTEVEDLETMLNRAPTKLLIHSEPENIRQLRDYWRVKLGDRAHVIITADEYLEFMSPLVNKGAAIERLAGHLGFGLGAVMAAGDSYNDMEMIRLSGIGLAVSTGREELKLVADHIIGPPQDNGLADFIEENLLG